MEQNKENTQESVKKREDYNQSTGLGWFVFLFIVVGIALSIYFLRGMFFDKSIFEKINFIDFNSGFVLSDFIYVFDVKIVLKLFYFIVFLIVSTALLFTYGFALNSEKRLNKFYRHYMSSDKSLNSLISDDVKIKAICDSYKDSFLKYGSMDWTRSNSDLYFGTGAWLEATSKIPTVAFLKMIPGTFIGLGILGTFIGFSTGVSELKFSASVGEGLDPVKLMTGVEVLLNGLQGAFITSIIGVVASIFLNVFVVHPFFHRMDSKTRVLCDELDKNFYLSDIDAFALKVSDTDDMIPFPESIKTIILKLDTVSNNMSAMTKEMAEKFEGLNVALSKVKENDLSNVAKTVKDAMGEIISNEMTRLRNETNAMITVIKECRENMENSPELLKTASETLNEALKSIVAQGKKNLSVVEKQSEAFSSVEKSIEDAASLLEKVKDTMENASEAMDLAYGQFASALTGAESVIEKNQFQAKELSENMNLAVAELEKMHSIYSESAKMNGELLSGFQKMDESISSVLEKFNDQTVRYSDVVGKSLESYLEKFQNATSGISNRFAESINSLSEEISRLTDEKSGGFKN